MDEKKVAQSLKIYIETAKQVPLAVYKAIFFGAKIFYKNNPLQVTYTSKQKLKQVLFGDYLFIEQSQNTTSKWAQMARQGHKIIWCVETKTKRYIGRVVDGVVASL